MVRFCRADTGLTTACAQYEVPVIVAVVALSWAAVSGVVALVIGGCVRMADERAPFTDHLVGLPADLTVADVLGARSPQPSH